MSRPASEYTQAIRSLLDESDGAITHAEARPKLKKMGFPIVPEQPDKSEAFAQFDEYKYDLNDEASVAAVIKACGFDDKVAKLVLREAKLRADFEKEANNYNVTKYNWNKNRDSSRPTPSQKPRTSRNTKAKTAAQTGRRAGTLPKSNTPKSNTPKPKHRRGRVAAVVAVGDNTDALDFVKSNGGVAAVQTRIAELRAEADQMEQAVNAVLDLQKRLKDAA